MVRPLSSLKTTRTSVVALAVKTERIFPPHGSSEFHRTASARDANASTVFCTMRALVANKRAAASLSLRSSDALQLRATCSGDCAS